MAGGQDPDCRRGFEWDQNIWNREIHQHLKKLIYLRQRIESLQKGRFEVLYADLDVMIYRRQVGRSAVIVGLNAKKEHFHTVLSGVSFVEGFEFHSDVWPDHCMGNMPLRLREMQGSQPGGALGVRSTERDLIVDLKPRGGAIWCAF